MTTLARIALLMAMMIACVGCDQVTKTVAARELRGRAPVSLLGNVVCLTYAENSGGFLSLGGELPPAIRSTLFVAFAALGVFALFAFAVANRSLDLIQVLGMGLMASGGVGNLVDRVLLGSARDFLLLRVGPVHTGVFNLADVAVTLGFALLLFGRFRARGIRSLE